MKDIQVPAGFLFLLMLHNSICIPLQHDNTRTETVENHLPRGQDFTVKRRSDGTFSNDYSKYLETRRAQGFLQWLMNHERIGVAGNAEVPRRRHVDGSFTSDVNKVLDSIAAKEYLQWVMNTKTPASSGKRDAN